MNDVVKPMLAGDITDCPEKLHFPVYVTPKLDGIRGLFTRSGIMSRSWKRIPHIRTQAHFAESLSWMAGLDCELIYGSPTAVDVYRQTQSRVATADNTDDITAYVFDDYLEGTAYIARLSAINECTAELHALGVRIVPSYHCANLEDLLRIEAGLLEEGYEGCILRSPEGLYKRGRSTVREQGMLKLKRCIDSEARVLGMEEELENTNEAKKDAFGRTERSSHKAGMKPKGSMGKLLVEDIHTGVKFKLGGGFSAKDREDFWKLRNKIPAELIVKYRSFGIGVKDKPRQGRYTGLRETWDL